MRKQLVFELLYRERRANRQGQDQVATTHEYMSFNTIHVFQEDWWIERERERVEYSQDHVTQQDSNTVYATVRTVLRDTNVA